MAEQKSSLNSSFGRRRRRKMEKILVVDDEATISTHLEEKLTAMGYEVVGRASSGEEAVEKAGKLRPELVLMDIVMGGRLDGIEAARIIRETWAIPCVFLTAYGDDKYIARAKNVEPLGYILKPFQDSALKASIEVALYNKKVAQRLRDSEQQWRLLAENLKDGIILGDCDGKIFFWNKGAEDIFGYKASEAMGQPLTFILPESHRQAYLKQLEQFFLTGRSGDLGKWTEIVGLRKDWSKFPLELCLAPWQIKDKVIFICLVRDITDRKKTEDGIIASLREKDRLLEEVREQIKNNLQAIYSLLDFQFEYLKGKQALSMLKESRARLKSIALMHEKLCSSKALARVDFATYIQNLANRLFEAFDADPDQIKLKINIQPAFLDIKTATACGLITSELVANSLKYAFPGERRGEVAVDFYQKGENRCALTVRDNGVGFPENLDFRAAKSLGLQIVNDLVCQLGGEIKLDRKGGTKFIISFQEGKA
jgi:PAS domain S-box-containing protein